MDQYYYTDKIILKTIDQRAEARIAKEHLLNVHVEAYMDAVTDDLIIRLTKTLPYEDVETIKIPMDWIQHIKERWYTNKWIFPKWFQKKYPIKYKTYVARAYYDKVAIPEHSPQLVFHRVTKGGSLLENDK